MSEYLTPTPPSAGTSSKTGTLFLSLFLLILAFFIVLVSISRVQETKTNAVKKSLGTAFEIITDSSVSDFTIKDSDDPDMYQAYLSEFPNGTFKRLAKFKIKKHEK